MTTEPPVPSQPMAPEPQAAPEGAVVSPDGQSWWDGQRWIPVAALGSEAAPEGVADRPVTRRVVVIGGVAVLVVAAAILVPRMLADENPLAAAVEECGAGFLGDEDRTLILDMEGEEALSGSLSYSDVTCVLDAVDTPDAVWDKMGRTTSLQGVQSDSWDGIEASWTYHPDQGLDIILELED